MVLGGILLFTVIGLGYGINQKSALPEAEQSATNESSFDGEFTLPEPVIFQKSQDSPGTVTFNHETHVDPSAPDCGICHESMFQIKPVVAGAPGSVNMEKLYEGQQCGKCHNGETGFSIEEGCEFCHVSE